MAEIMNNNKIKTIAFYLPQFHSIPENDKWWGKGFTEWTNTKKAKPLFEGHYQPKTPLNENFYDLSDVTVMEKQAEMAKEYGLYGFCYYHYWFKDGKKLLEKPIENMLKDKKVDIPFCLCWANENWARNWDGGNKEIIMPQDYGTKKDWESHFQYLIEFFKDERYITVNGKPIMLIYKPEQIYVFDKMVDYWQKRAVEEGLPGLIIMSQYPLALHDPAWNSSRIEYSIKFEPTSASMIQLKAVDYLVETVRKRKFVGKIKKILFHLKLQAVANNLFRLRNKKNEKAPKLEILDYDETWKIILNHEIFDKTIINGAFVDWDNTARNVKGRMYQGATPEKFRKYLIELSQRENPLNIIFINAWNEWAEGAYLEPDEKNGFAYLEALKAAMETVNS